MTEYHKGHINTKHKTCIYNNRKWKWKLCVLQTRYEYLLPGFLLARYSIPLSSRNPLHVSFSSETPSLKPQGLVPSAKSWTLPTLPTLPSLSIVDDFLLREEDFMAVFGIFPFKVFFKDKNQLKGTYLILFSPRTLKWLTSPLEILLTEEREKI